MTRQPHTIVFWGAGATAALGMRTTAQQTGFLSALADARKNGRPLERRVACAVGEDKACWASALRDLLTILGDSKKEDPSPFAIAPGEMAAMRRNWRPGADDDKIRNRIADLRALYDWPALKAVIDVCPGARNGEFKITDLFNLLDMHGQSGHGFRVPEGGFLTPQRVSGAYGALKMLLHAMFYIDWQHGRVAKRRVLDRHYEFAVALGRRMQRQGVKLAKLFDSRDFYMADVGFASMNYDPIALWLQFVAHRDLNTSPAVPYVGSPAARLQIFHDLGHFVAGPRVRTSGGRDSKTPWHPMNETSAQRLNDADHDSRDRIRIAKFLFPHGCLWWRECPDCGKLSSYMGDSWDRDSPVLFPPPPLKAFAPDGMFRPRPRGAEKKAWDEGEVDARACIHCETLTYAHHTQTAMQSNFKSPPPPFMEEMRRDLRVAVQNARHIVFMGYSLPPDDVEYRAFFAARHRRNLAGGAGDSVRCSVVVDTRFGRRWLRSNEWPDMLPDMDAGEAPRATLEAARDLFGEKNVRFYGGGIPDVFLDGGDWVTDSAVNDLLNWESA